MIAVVKRGPNQIVHTRIDNCELFLDGLLDVKDAREQNARVADQQPARFEQDSQIQIAQCRQNRIHIFPDR